VVAFPTFERFSEMGHSEFFVTIAETAGGPKVTVDFDQEGAAEALKDFMASPDVKSVETKRFIDTDFISRLS
jgi:hypothetical protein